MPRRVVIVLVTGAAVLVALSFLAGYAASPDSPAHLFARTADEWEAMGTWAAVVLASIAAVIALRQAQEARQLRIEQAQAYVVAFIESNPNSPEVVELVVRNVGVTAAKDVQITTDTPLRRTGRSSQDVEPLWFPTSIPFLAPGQEWRTVWDFARARNDSPILKDENVHVMTMTYIGVEAAGRQTTVATLDWSPFKGRIWMDEKTIHHAARALGEMRILMKGWTERRRLSIFTRDGDARDERNREEGMLWRAQQEAAQAAAEEAAQHEDDRPPLTGDAEPPSANEPPADEAPVDEPRPDRPESAKSERDEQG